MALLLLILYLFVNRQGRRNAAIGRMERLSCVSGDGPHDRVFILLLVTKSGQ